MFCLYSGLPVEMKNATSKAQIGRSKTERQQLQGALLP